MMIKVSDFGLAKDIYESSYYRAGNKSKELPVRWMSIEAMKYSLFTTQSDVVCILWL